jgi:hypothetical protein
MSSYSLVHRKGFMNIPNTCRFFFAHWRYFPASDPILDSNLPPETHWRLLEEPWAKDPKVQHALKDANATYQSITEGFGENLYDEYSFTIDKMTQDLTPEAFLSQLLRDMNGTVNNATFNFINKFKRRNKGEPKIGDIYDIDILGFINCSVILTCLSDSSFTFSTITTPEFGIHPEFGSREFGFKRNGEESVTFYTRGLSRPKDSVVGAVGAVIQETSWTSFMEGIRNTMESKGSKIYQDFIIKWKA